MILSPGRIVLSFFQGLPGTRECGGQRRAGAAPVAGRVAALRAAARQGALARRTGARGAGRAHLSAMLSFHWSAKVYF